VPDQKQKPAKRATAFKTSTHTQTSFFRKSEFKTYIKINTAGFNQGSGFKKKTINMDYTLIFLFAAGGAGALLKDIMHDNALEIPKKQDGKLILGFLGGAIAGGFVGMLVDHSIITAFMSGYAGTSVLANLLQNKNIAEASTNQTIEDIIRTICKEEKVDPNLAIKVAKCESNLNPKAININTGGDRDRGLFQINEKWHPEVTDEQAFDPFFATKFFCKAFKGGFLSWWDASKKCWGA